MIDRLTNIFGSATKALEILYLMSDIKPVVRQGFYEHELPKIKRFCEANDLSLQVSPYKVVLVDTGKEYSNKGVKVRLEDERKGMLFVYISKDEEKAVLADCYELKNNHAQFGHILGYPKCCIKFFVKHEPMRSKLDNDYVGPCLENSEGKVFPFYNNILLRNQDITLLNHFPCSFNCEESMDLARKHLIALKKQNLQLADVFVNKLKGYQRLYRRILKFV